MLAQALGLIEKPGPLQPQLSPENVVLVGLREASPAEAANPEGFARHRLHHGRDRRVGHARVMREAIRIATTGTRGFHVSYSPTATEIARLGRGLGRHDGARDASGDGGDRAQWRHDLDGRLGPDPGLEQRVAAEALSFVMSAFGKRIL